MAKTVVSKTANGGSNPSASVFCKNWEAAFLAASQFCYTFP